MTVQPTDRWLLPFLATIRTRPGMFLGDERVETLETEEFLHATGQSLDNVGRWMTKGWLVSPSSVEDASNNDR